MPEGWLDDLLGFATTAPFFYWYLRKWQLLIRLRNGGSVATAIVLRKFGHHVSYRYQDESGRVRVKSLAMEKDIARGLQKGSAFPLLYLPHQRGFSCPAEAVEASIKRNKRALRNFTIFTVICFILPYLAF